MELSYTAYNPILSQFVPGIPSSFIQEPFNEETKTAEIELKSVGFDATAYNYEAGAEIYAAHTIGHRKITINNNNTIIGDNNNDINGNIAAVVNTGSGIGSALSVVETDTRETLRNAIQSGEIVSEIDESASRTSDNGRTLIVVSIRGSVTPLDWAIDVGNQFNAEHLNNQGTFL